MEPIRTTVSSLQLLHFLRIVRDVITEIITPYISTDRETLVEYVVRGREKSPMALASKLNPFIYGGELVMAGLLLCCGKAACSKVRLLLGKRFWTFFGGCFLEEVIQ